ncbi:MAG: hypothetical protein BGP05_04595 [Rhizobiales bacterium 62-47]|nr:MAG: hypothetical protein BGP05_04595 [Rhizobiales bacterium 62-47]
MYFEYIFHGAMKKYLTLAWRAKRVSAVEAAWLIRGHGWHRSTILTHRLVIAIAPKTKFALVKI